MLIRIDVNAGHGGKRKLQIDEWADVWSFCYANMSSAEAAK
jgi:prolyl oligopeptidase